MDNRRRPHRRYQNEVCPCYENFGGVCLFEPCNKSHDVSPKLTMERRATVVTDIPELYGVIEFEVMEGGNSTKQKFYIPKSINYHRGAKSGQKVQLIISQTFHRKNDCKFARISKILSRMQKKVNVC